MWYVALTQEIRSFFRSAALQSAANIHRQDLITKGSPAASKADVSIWCSFHALCENLFSKEADVRGLAFRPTIQSAFHINPAAFREHVPSMIAVTPFSLPPHKELDLDVGW